MKLRWSLFLLAAAAALALRWPQLDNRPMHNDEAVNAVKFGVLWEGGGYKYDPAEHHGPALHYLTAAFCQLTGAPGFKSISEIRLRAVTVVAGVGLVLLLPLIRDGIGRRAVVAAAFFTALSPALTFYSRDWIHETLLVLFTFLALAAGWRCIRQPSWGWAGLAGAALGLMQATKETFLLPLLAAAGALALTALWRRDAAAPCKGQPRYWGIAIAAWFIVATILLTSFFTNWAGIPDSVRTYLPWLRRAGGDSPHIHGVTFYLERLFWFQAGNGPLWTEAFILLLAGMGAIGAFRRDPRAEGSPGFIRFLSFYTVLLAAFYSLIPYKTPWCALGFLHPLILLAGVGAAELWRMAASKWRQVVVAGGLLVGAAHLGWQAWRASFPLCADRANPWVYAQTSPDVLNLVETVGAVVQAGQGASPVIAVMARDGDYWPLPWYLRQYDHVGWWDRDMPDTAPVMILSPGFRSSTDLGRTHVMAGCFALRPGVFLELHVERALWEKRLRGN